MEKSDYGAALAVTQHLDDIRNKRNPAAMEALPNEAQCKKCGWFDITHPGVMRILMARDPSGRLNQQAHCRCADIQAALVERRWQQCNLPSDRIGGRSFDTYEVRPGTEELYEAAWDFSQGKGPAVLVLVSGTGTGKSHLIEAILRRELENNKRVRYELSMDFLDALRHTFSDDFKQDLIDLLAWYQSFQVLGLDDIGMERASDFAGAELTRLLDTRIQRARRTVVATNLRKEQMAQRLGDRLASRLYESNRDVGTVRCVVSEAGDYRNGG